MTSRIPSYPCALASVLLACMPGCTLGYGIVEGISSASAHEVVPDRVGQLADCGVTEIELITDSAVVVGTLTGVESVDSSLYVARWTAWATPLGFKLRPGDSVEVTRTELLRLTVSGRFMGMSEGKVHLQHSRQNQAIPLRSIHELRHGDDVWSRKDLQRIVVDHPPPALMCLSVMTDDGTFVTIPVDAIRVGAYRRSFNGRGFFVTIPVDIAVGFLIAAALGNADYGF